MNKCVIILTYAFLLMACFCMEAKVFTEKSGKILMVKFHSDDVSSVTFESFAEDYREAVMIAQKKKCTYLTLYDKEGNPFEFIRGKEEIANVDKYLDSFRREIDSMERSEYIQGKLISTKTVLVSSAKYRQETYLNGSLYSTYESDWSQGYFAPSTSTFISGNDTFVTKTFYVGPKYKEEETHELGETIVTEGIKVFVEKVYIQD